ncbi:tripartite tricarboxylate transporter substrate binding protein [Nitratireductor sp. OM-1]|uniref:Bug family tripartite tricarboxylate transporter substrate binding protein n=1 Tax=Nitratireductor sp. OM-1 TaxID=1756988 RepID=UPI000DDC4511|nr:tripartite tricarboxylate transporter substrate binding protein [Nitratireductor sp. OM-1]
MFGKLLRAALAATAVLGVSMGAAMADWPSKPIQIIIPWPAPNDPSTLVANAIAPVMSDELGVPVKVVNKPGGGAVLGAADLANARPDGYTMGLVSIGPIITQVLRGKTPYKNDDLQPLGLVWSSPFTLAARADAPYSNLDELAEYGKKNELRLAHWGLGAVPTLIAMKVAETGGFEWKETAYSELNPLLVVQGDADVITFSTPGLTDYIDAGKMKILAAMVPDRLPAYPDVPNVSEQGYGDAYSIWFGAFVPKQTDKEIVSKLSAAFFSAMKNEKVAEVIENVGVVPHSSGPDEARARMDRELAEFGTTMKNLGIME